MTDENNYRSIISERIEVLRKKLLDTTRRNPLINNSFSPKTLSFLRIVDEKPQSIVNILFRGDEMQLSPLPKLDSEPADAISLGIVILFGLIFLSSPCSPN